MRGAVALCLGLVCLTGASQAEPPAYSPGLMTTAAGARYILSDRVDLFLASLDAGSGPVLKAVLKADDPAAQTLWPAVMAGALQVRHQAGDQGETLWFNPVIDAGLLIRWRRGPNGWSASDAWWVLGSDIRSDGPQGQAIPVGLAADDWRPAAMQAYAARVLETAADPHWQTPGAAADRNAEVWRRAQAAARALQAFQGAQGYGGAMALTESLLAVKDPDRLGPTLGPALQRYGVDARNSLRATSAYRQGQAAWTLVAQSPDAPGVAWFVHFHRADGAPARITGIDVVNYARPGRAS